MRSSVFCMAFLTAYLSVASFSIAQIITRDVGEIAVIEGDGLTIPPSNMPCTALTVEVDEVAKRFYRTHDPVYQGLIVFSNFTSQAATSNGDCSGKTGKFARGGVNEIRGIGKERVTADPYESSGTLEVLVSMNNVTPSPADPNDRFSGSPYSVMSLMAQEVGHRWGANVHFDSTLSNKLLGRDLGHWSFFFHTASVTSTAAHPKASVLAGQFWLIDKPCPGEFQAATVTSDDFTTDGFCQLDLYLMGLLPPSEVDPFWYIDTCCNQMAGETCASITDCSGGCNECASSPPRVGATDSPLPKTVSDGSPRFVDIDDVILAEGPRVPHFANSPKIFRQAFVLLTRQGMDVTRAELDQLETYRVAWESYFAEETQDRGAVITNLDDVVFVDRTNPCPVPLRDCDGTVDDPFPTVGMGQFYTPTKGTLVITAGTYPGNLTISKAMTLRAVRGTVTIGG